VKPESNANINMLSKPFILFFTMFFAFFCMISTASISLNEIMWYSSSSGSFPKRVTLARARIEYIFFQVFLSFSCQCVSF